MTESRPDPRPSTEAGKRLLDELHVHAGAHDVRAAILAIEAEARSSHSDVSADLRAALAKLPLGPYRVDGPHEQGGMARIYGKQGTPPDFTDGWAIPLVAAGVPVCIDAIAAILNALAAPSAGAASYPPPISEGDGDPYV